MPSLTAPPPRRFCTTPNLFIQETCRQPRKLSPKPFPKNFPSYCFFWLVPARGRARKCFRHCPLCVQTPAADAQASQLDRILHDSPERTAGIGRGVQARIFITHNGKSCVNNHLRTAEDPVDRPAQALSRKHSGEWNFQPLDPQPKRLSRSLANAIACRWIKRYTPKTTLLETPG